MGTGYPWLPVSIEKGSLRLDLFSIPSLEHGAGEEIIRNPCDILPEIDFEVVVRTSRPMRLA